MNRLNCLSEKSREDTINDWIFWAVNFYHKYVWNAYFSASGENRTNDSGSVETVNLTVYCRKLVCTTLLIRQAKMIF